ncbi:MAG TPA: beta-galactosidase, partial [Candidatus Acidoferrales bacterium]|nr:beta-galactosidase [Candidatus Acidoferrales bacterium]
NEYGSFDRDHAYMSAIRDSIRRAGLGEVLLYTADGPSQLPDGTLPDLPAAVNFGPGEAPNAFAALHAFRPEQPIMAGEYWDGWFDSWGHPHAHTDSAQQTAELDWMLSQGASVSLYMFHGGTTFGFMNGANATRQGYSPQTTSYDYDSPLDESGRPTKKFFAFRNVISKHRDPAAAPLPDLPPPQPIISIPEFPLTGYALLTRNLPAPTASENLRTMESLGQSYGYILYRTFLHAAEGGDLVISGLHDFAAVYVNQSFVGTIDRRLDQDRLTLERVPDFAILDILVENTGRINFSKALLTERKGITGNVAFNGSDLSGWQIFSLPTNDVSHVRTLVELPPDCKCWLDVEHPEPKPVPAPRGKGPVFYRGYFSLQELGDTFLDTRAFTKGAVWVNGHPLGRIWRIGPQQTLYLPAPFLRLGKNEVIVFDIPDAQSPQTPPTLRGLPEPILDELHLSGQP